MLVDELGLVPGNRVLLHGPTRPSRSRRGSAILLAGGVVVATMPLLRAGEIAKVIGKAQVTPRARRRAARGRGRGAAGELRELRTLRRRWPPAPRARSASSRSTTARRRRRDHRLHLRHDRRAEGLRALPPRPAGVVRHVRRARPAPAPERRLHRHAAAGVHVRARRARAVPAALRRVDRAGRASPARTRCSRRSRAHGDHDARSPRRPAYRALLRARPDLGARLRTCVSAGEPLPAGVVRRVVRADRHPHRRRHRLDRDAAHLHRARRRGGARAGSAGAAGARATRRGSSTTDMRPLPPGEVGRLAVRGPTGCRYLDDPRQSDYVVDGWNLTGDAFRDGRGRLLLVPGAHRRHDHLLRLQHLAASRSRPRCSSTPPSPSARSSPRPTRSAATSSRRSSSCAGASRRRRAGGELQDHVKARIAPYKYPRRIEFVDALPRTPTGKVQRNVLRERSHEARLQPPGWPRPRGYANGIAAPRAGSCSSPARSAGTPTGAFPSPDLAGQVAPGAANIVAVLAEAGAGPEHVARLTWYVTDRDDYLAAPEGDRRGLPRRHGPPLPGDGGRRRSAR